MTENYVSIAPDVKLGKHVKLSKFINLYGCEVGDNTKIGAFVEIQKNARVGNNCKISSHSFICEGVNIEDGSDEPMLLASKIEAIRSAVSKARADLFVNVRTDVFLAGLVEDSKRVEESIGRGKLYAKAGADGLFVPGIVQPQDIKAVVAGVALPLNVMAWPGLADAAELGKLGVRRLSAGSSISQVLWGTAERLARDFLKSGRSEHLEQGSMSYPQLQGLFPCVTHAPLR